MFHNYLCKSIENLCPYTLNGRCVLMNAESSTQGPFYKIVSIVGILIVINLHIHMYMYYTADVCTTSQSSMQVFTIANLAIPPTSAYSDETCMFYNTYCS